MKLVIVEMFGLKRHTYNLSKFEGMSFTYGVEGNYLVLRNYYDGKVLKRINVSKMGSINFCVDSGE